MDSQPLFDHLRRELWRQGLPPRYVERVVRELQEHQEDILAEETGALDQESHGRVSRLGEPTQLAGAIAAEYRTSTFAGRHPILAFVAFPVPLVLLVWLSFLVAFGVIGSLLGRALEEELNRSALEWPPGLLWGVLTFHYAFLVVPPAVTALLCCRWSYRCGRSRWSWAACGLIGILAGSVLWSLRLSGVPGESSLTLGTLLATPGLVRMSDFSLARQLLQASVPVAVGTLFLVRRRRQFRRLSLDRNRLLQA